MIGVRANFRFQQGYAGSGVVAGGERRPEMGHRFPPGASLSFGQAGGQQQALILSIGLEQEKQQGAHPQPPSPVNAAQGVLAHFSAPTRFRALLSFAMWRRFTRAWQWIPAFAGMTANWIPPNDTSKRCGGARHKSEEFHAGTLSARRSQ